MIHIPVKNKIAISPEEKIVCGNSGYQILFSFDTEWDEYPTKTARFVWNDEHIDVDFNGNVCDVPVIMNATLVKVGVFAGDLRTTTAAAIEATKCILCGTTQKGEPIKVAPKSGFIPLPERAEVGQIIKVAAVDDRSRPTAWEPVNLPTKLSDLENDLWYTKRETVVNLTLEDFILGGTGMPAYEMDKVNLAGSDKFGFQISCTTTEGGSFSGTEADLGGFVVETYGNGTIWTNESLLVIANGLAPGENGYIEVDKCTVYLLPDLSEVNLTLEIISEKKIPIEYCDTSEIEAEIDGVNGEVI